MPIDDFGPLKLKTLRAMMIKEKDWVRSVVNRRINMIVRMFKWGASEQLVPVHIYQSLATVENLHKGRSEARESKRVRPVSDAHIIAVLPYLKRAQQRLALPQKPELKKLWKFLPEDFLNHQQFSLNTECPVVGQNELQPE